MPSRILIARVAATHFGRDDHIMRLMQFEAFQKRHMKYERRRKGATTKKRSRFVTRSHFAVVSDYNDNYIGLLQRI